MHRSNGAVAAVTRNGGEILVRGGHRHVSSGLIVVVEHAAEVRFRLGEIAAGCRDSAEQEQDASLRGPVAEVRGLASSAPS